MEGRASRFPPDDLYLDLHNVNFDPSVIIADLPRRDETISKDLTYTCTTLMLFPDLTITPREENVQHCMCTILIVYLLTCLNM